MSLVGGHAPPPTLPNPNSGLNPRRFQLLSTSRKVNLSHIQRMNDEASHTDDYAVVLLSKTHFPFLGKQINLHSLHGTTHLTCVIAVSRLQQLKNKGGFQVAFAVGSPRSKSPGWPTLLAAPLGVTEASAFPPVTGCRRGTALCSRLVPVLF